MSCQACHLQRVHGSNMGRGLLTDGGGVLGLPYENTNLVSNTDCDWETCPVTITTFETPGNWGDKNSCNGGHG